MSDRKQFKKIAFLTPRPGMDLHDFSTYWRDVHGPTVANSPGYSAYRTRYAQNHRIGDGPVGACFPYPGIAVFHLPGNGFNEEAFSESPIYRDRIRIDELNFIDMDRTVSMVATENVIRPGTGPVKVLILGSRRDGFDRVAFDRRLIDACTGALLSARGFMDRLRGWTLNHIVEGSFRLPGARPADAVAVDCIQELWFESELDMAAAYASPAYRDNVAPTVCALFSTDHLFSFRAWEIVFFDKGRPCQPVPLS